MKGRRKREEGIATVYLLPALIPIVVFWLIPSVLTVGLSFTNWDMISPSIEFVGLNNYEQLLKDANFREILSNTMIFAASVTFFSVFGGLLLALMINSLEFTSRIWRTILFAPYITPMVAVSIVWSWIFEPNVGIMNYVLSFLGAGPYEWMKSMDTAMLSVVIVTVWKQLGWTMLFYLEALLKIPQNVLEASKVDGAASWSVFWKIKFPLISPTTFFLVIVSTISSLQAYDQIQVLTQGGPAGSTRTLLYYYYQEAFGSFNVGKASAVAVFLVLFTIILTVIETVLSKKSIYYA